LRRRRPMAVPAPRVDPEVVGGGTWEPFDPEASVRQEVIHPEPTPQKPS
jgi:hypothetical protein